MFKTELWEWENVHLRCKLEILQHKSFINPLPCDALDLCFVCICVTFIVWGFHHVCICSYRYHTFTHLCITCSHFHYHMFSAVNLSDDAALLAGWCYNKAILKKKWVRIKESRFCEKSLTGYTYCCHLQCEPVRRKSGCCCIHFSWHNIPHLYGNHHLPHLPANQIKSATHTAWSSLTLNPGFYLCWSWA